MSGRNRLAGEQSPYLLQHQNNPVDWFPWGEEAFARAAEQDQPIFLSIGYATCHWCHVMEKESFEDATVARLLNENFVSIKVDREERPDIDAIYMSVCQMLSGQGGWPLTIVMTPDRKPFFAATYIPKHSRHGRLGLVELVPRIVGVWNEQREDVLQSAEHLTQTLQRSTENHAEADPLGEDTLVQGFEQLRARYDPHHGGFGSAPKFPTPHNMLFLLRYWSRTNDPLALEMAAHTLAQMQRGGIFDQIGGGFHRYATDARWHLPHFEKMLYDQALITIACAEAYQATGTEAFETTARSVIEYAIRDLGAPEGAFYSAEDADSEGREGKFYVWTLAEVEQVLDPDDAALAARAFGLLEDGNFEDEATRERTGENVLFRATANDALAREFGGTPDEIGDRLQRICQQLFEHRKERVRPALDDKVLTDWNGLFIAALAIAGRTFGDNTYVDRARKAAAFILQAMRGADGTLLHRYRGGEAGIPAMADDYAALVWALVELYQSTFDPRYLQEALAWSDQMHALLADEERGGYFLARSDAQDLIVRQKEVYDGAIPSANSIQAWNLIRLSRLTGRTDLAERADQVFAYAAPYVAQHPSAHTALLIALEHARSPSAEVVVAGDPASEATGALLEIVRSGYRPNLVVLQHAPSSADGTLRALAPFVAQQQPVDGKPAAYLCRNFACERPTTDPEQLRQMLDEATAA